MIPKIVLASQVWEEELSMVRDDVTAAGITGQHNEGGALAHQNTEHTTS